MEIKMGAAYIRVSSDDQLEYSPDSQLKAIREYAKREGYLIPDEYVYQDDGISGKSASKRPAFRLMIATAKADAPPFDSIFVWKYSRFARNQEEAIMYKNLLKKKGIAVKSISEPSSDSPFSSLIERIIEWMDEYYLINLSGEVRRGMAEKAARGEAMSTAPFGYTVKDKTFVENADADIVRYIFHAFVSGTNTRSLAVELCEKGVRTRRGNLPDNRWVHYILTNPTYIGKIRWSKEGHANYDRHNYAEENVMVVDGKHAPIIDMETWAAAQKRLNESRNEIKYIRAKNPQVFMLKGLLRCSNCGSTLTHSSAKEPSLQCHKYAKGQCNVSHHISVSAANATTISAMEQIIQTQNFTFSPRKPKKEPLRRDWDKLIATEYSRLERAKTAFLDGVFTQEDYKSAKQSIEANLAKLQEGKAAEQQSHAMDVDLEAYTKKVSDVLAIIKSPDVTEQAKGEALRTVVDKIIYNKAEKRFDIFFAS